MTGIVTSDVPIGDGSPTAAPDRVAGPAAGAMDATADRAVDSLDDGADDDAVTTEPVDAAHADLEHAGLVRRVRRGLTWPRLILAVVIVVYVAHYTRRSLDIHHGLGTSSYDSALYDQGLWLMSRFEAPFVTLMGRNLFGDHSSFVLLFLVPFYWIWPSAGVLFASQSVALGAGAIPVFLAGRSRLHNEWVALLLAAGYLVHPALGWTNLENFHPDSFLGVFVGFAVWAALDRKWKTYAVFVVLALSVKEDASLVVVPLGMWVAIKRDRRIGLITMLSSVVFTLVAMFVVMRSLIGVATRNGWRIPFGGPEGVIETALTDPGELFRYLTSDDRPWYLVQMTAPFAWLFARKPTVAAISGLVLFTNILSTYWYQYQIDFHYSLIAVPALSIGTVYAIGAIREKFDLTSDPSGRSVSTVVRSRYGASIGAVVAAAALTSYLWSPVPWGRSPQYYGNPDDPWALAGHQIIERIPSDAVVSAHYRITPHAAHRLEIYQFPTPFRAVLYGPNGNVDGPRIPDRAERVEYVVLPVDDTSYPAQDWTAVESAFVLVDQNEFWLLYQRNIAAPIPPELE
jgi:uncharacterized membrane protein